MIKLLLRIYTVSIVNRGFERVGAGEAGEAEGAEGAGEAEGAGGAGEAGEAGIAGGGGGAQRVGGERFLHNRLTTFMAIEPLGGNRLSNSMYFY